MNLRKLATSGALSALCFLGACMNTKDRTAQDLTLAENGKTQYQIIQSDQATEAEKYAALELAEFLKRVSGASFSITTESFFKGSGPGIYVGWTKYAKQNGINSANLGEEEWIIRTDGKNLIITGGRPRGALYGVYEFLEDQVGCHWLDQDTEIIPAKPTLTLSSLNIQAKPWFWQRQVHSPTGVSDKKWKFMIRNKNYRYDMKGRKNFFPKGAFYKLDGFPGKRHSFSYFVNASEWFDSHPEYFSLGSDGKHIPAYDGSGPGQLCLTNPDVLHLTLKNLRKFIKNDRDEAKKKGCPPPKVYGINQNDKYDAHCRCEKCQAIVKREGSESGPLIAFINAVAENIEKDYPDILIGTIAYNKTSMPPNNLKPRKNVIIGWCDVYSKCDGIRPLKHPYNSSNMEELIAWEKISPHIAIGDDYWTALSYYDFFPTPYSIIDCIASDIKFFADQKAESFFAEAAEYCEAGQQFVPLRTWLAYQLLVDPYQPVEPLIKIFMQGYYGSAADEMNKYLKYLRKRINKDAQFKMLRNAPHKLKYLDLEFFVTSERIFDKAETLVASNSLADRHVQNERFILDGALLFLWPWLKRSLPPGETMPFDHEKVIKRYEKEWRTFVKSRFSRTYSHNKFSLNNDGKLLSRMTNTFRGPELPEEFHSLPSHDVADFNWLTFSTIRPRMKILPDPKAAGGMAATFAAKRAIEKAEKGGDKKELSRDEQFRQPLLLGATNGPTIKVKPEDIPQDEKYHIYKIGRIRIRPGSMVWAFKGKRLGVNVDRLFVPGSEDPFLNEWNAYISLKVQGPAYVKGSKKANGVWMDRVLLAKPQKGEVVDKAYLEELEKERKRLALRPKVKISHLSKKVNGDPLKVDWTEIAETGKWTSLKGTPSPRDVSAKFACDNNYLYVCLAEKMDSGKLVNDPDVWRGDDWEFLFAEKRGSKPYRQIAINPNGKFRERAYAGGKWISGAKIISQKDADFWKMFAAFPLNRLLHSGKVETGQKIYLNIMRGGKRPLVWSPTFGEGFHSLERFGEITLE